VADILVRYLKATGFTDGDIHVLAEEKYPNQVNVVVRLKGKGEGRPILWNGHMDVVEAKPQDWSLPPFQFIEKDGYFYGRGTSDMKDEDAAVAASLIRLKKEGFIPDRDIIVAFTADEEVGEEQDGMWYLVREHKPLVDAETAINPDGASGEIDNGNRLNFGIETPEKTYVTFTLQTTNKGGHSSEPRPGNAIYRLANGLVRLSHYEFPFTTNATTRIYFAKTAMTQTGQMRADMQALAAPKLDLAAAERVAGDPPFNAILHSTCVATMLSGGHPARELKSVRVNGPMLRTDTKFVRCPPTSNYCCVLTLSLTVTNEPPAAACCDGKIGSKPKTVDHPAPGAWALALALFDTLLKISAAAGLSAQCN
jgi:acetylornithine deacetylase/succinyl-diaminopimelate desuccinylase-like protein